MTASHQQNVMVYGIMLNDADWDAESESRQQLQYDYDVEYDIMRDDSYINENEVRETFQEANISDEVWFVLKT